MDVDFVPSPAFDISLPHWDVKVAVNLAKKYGITLTMSHFEILDLARSFFFEY